jgi:hypothetical protein
LPGHLLSNFFYDSVLFTAGLCFFCGYLLFDGLYLGELLGLLLQLPGEGLRVKKSKRYFLFGFEVFNGRSRIHAFRLHVQKLTPIQ